MTVLLAENLDTLRLIQSNIYYKLKNLLAHSWGNGSELHTHWHPSFGCRALILCTVLFAETLDVDYALFGIKVLSK